MVVEGRGRCLDLEKERGGGGGGRALDGVKRDGGVGY